MGNLQKYSRGMILIITAMFFVACSVKKDIQTKEQIVNIDTSRQVVNIVTKDSTHVHKVIQHVDSITKTYLRIEPKGEFTWDPGTGYKGEASTFNYYQYTHTSKVHQELDSLKHVITDSLEQVFNNKFESLRREMDEKSDTGSGTPAWAYMLFIFLTAYLVYKFFK